MQVLTGHSNIPEAAQGAVIALGNFDGVHAGHRAVIDTARALASQLDAPLGIALFEPHPRRYFAPDARPFRLMSSRCRDETLATLGVQQVYALSFDQSMAAMTPAQFVQSVLHEGLGVAGVVTGEDFNFGVGRSGSIADLRALCETHGIETEFARLHANGVDKVSSTRIRKAIHDGDMSAAAELLGQRWSVDGVVIRGDQRGRTIGFPTANIDLTDYVRPDYGVYAVMVQMLGSDIRRPAVANIGKRPTVGGETELLEVHLLDFSDDLYGQELRIEFYDHLRREQKFDGLDALKAQIAADATAAKQVLAQV
jgi:riboflavin kinase/FMN adenylyltransferase